MTTELGRLHVLTDVRPGRDAITSVRAAVAAGTPVVQVRAKDGTDRQRFEFARRVVGICAAHEVTCIINDRLDLALAAGADGTHLGADDLPVAAARRIVGPDHLIGATARDPDQARALVAAGADYLGVGPAFSSTSKVGLPAPLGPSGIAAVCTAVPVPVIAIGGVTASRVGQLLAAGAHGVAVVAAISAAPDPAAATREFLHALDAGARLRQPPVEAHD